MELAGRLRIGKSSLGKCFLCSASGVSSDLQLPGTAARLEVRPALPRHGSGLLVRRCRFAAETRKSGTDRNPVFGEGAEPVRCKNSLR